MLPMLNPVSILRSSSAGQLVSNMSNPMNIIRNSSAGALVGGIAGAAFAFKSMILPGSSSGGGQKGGSGQTSQPINIQFARYVDGVNIRLDKLIKASHVFADIQNSMFASGEATNAERVGREEEEEEFDDLKKKQQVNKLAALAGALSTLASGAFWSETFAGLAATMRKWGQALLKSARAFFANLWKGLKSGASFIGKTVSRIFSGVKMPGVVRTVGARLSNLPRLMQGLGVLGRTVPIVSALLVPAFEIAKNAPELKKLGDKLDAGEITQDEYDEKATETVVKIAFKSVGTIAGAGAGAVVGQALFPLIPLVPALAGAVGGAFAGSIAGQILTDKLAPSIKKGLATGAIGPAVKAIEEVFTSEDTLREILTKTGLKEGQINAILKKNKVAKSPASSTSVGTPGHSSLAVPPVPMPAPSAPSSSPTPAAMTGSAQASPTPAAIPEVPSSSNPSPAAMTGSAQGMEGPKPIEARPQIASVAPALASMPTATTGSSAPAAGGTAEVVVINGVQTENNVAIISAPPAPVKSAPIKMSNPNAAAAHA